MPHSTAHQKLTRDQVHDAVRASYGVVARTRNIEDKEGAACCGPSCCGGDNRARSDYTPEELAAVPKNAYLGEGSGVPVRHAELKPGQVVVDLGAGAGMDTFLAANAVGPAGRVHGFDMTPDMLERARRNAVAGNYAQVSFERADIEKLPLADRAADAAISNCVINLAPDKPAVFREVFRVLRPGGRLSIADIVLRGDGAALAALRSSSTPDSWCACVSGALDETAYLEAIRSAGFDDVQIAAERPGQIQPGGEVRAVAVTITACKP